METYVGTDTIDFILHRDKPKDRRATYVRIVCYIRPQKKRLMEQDSLQNEIPYTIEEKSVHPHQT